MHLILSFDDSAVVDILDGEGDGEFESGRFPFIFGAFGIALIDAGHFFDGSEDIFAVSFIFLSFLIIAQSVES